MKILLFVALICVSLVHVSPQQQEQEEKLEMQIRKLQDQVKFLFKHVRLSNEDLKEMFLNSFNVRNLEEVIRNLQEQVWLLFKYVTIPNEDSKEMSFKLLSKSEKESLPCFKETYLSERGKNDRTTLNLSDVPKARKELSDFKLSSQAQDDIIELSLHSMQNNAIDSVVRNTFIQLKVWQDKHFNLTATNVEQILAEFANEKGQMNYEFLREDFNECLKLYEMDLSKKLAPDTVRRIISLHRIMYGNRTEIETALSYLYGPANDSSTLDYDPVNV